MGKMVDLTGQRFGKLTVTKLVGSHNYRRIWECQCDCGNIRNYRTSDLTSKHCMSCGCSRIMDLTGQRFGRLTVIERDLDTKNKWGIYWKCKCDCGNEKSVQAGALRSGATQSCGCLNKEIISQQKDIPDMIGKQYGKLTIIERAETHITPSGQKKTMWRCKCECGNETIVSSQDLKSGHTKSCGCLPTKVRGMGLIDLVGERFGKLTVIERAEDYEYTSKDGEICCIPQWLCLCDCGNHVIVQGGNLRNGNTTHCGCDRVYSVGESLVAEFLTKNNIKYLREYTFDDLRSEKGGCLRFDFGILNDNNELITLVEYQGEQHYLDDDSIEFGLYQRKYSDKMKRDYCSQNNIPLYEIRFDEDIDEALLKLLNNIKKYIEI